MKTLAIQRRVRGVAAVEFAVILPLLLFMVLPLADLARAMQAQMILTAISREGADLASRASLVYSSQQVMGALSSTTPPLDMANRGMIYITKIMGNKECTPNCVINNRVLEQYRWAQGWNQSHFSPSGAIWTCGMSGTSWANDGSCSNIPSPGSGAPLVNVMAGQLAAGQIIYLVESFYQFNPILPSINLGAGLVTPQMPSGLYAMTIF